ncbi:MAG: hypothetical protein K6A43_06245 [Treponema sp.]|nr:hypothetical protein [Treponema sp.]
MKKSVVLMLAAVSLLLSSFLVSCGNAADGAVKYLSAVDTVEQLNAPSVNGAAYYGVNYVYWDAVAGANGYTLYRNGVLMKTYAKDTDNLVYEDVAIEDGKSYKYQVVAISASDPSRAVYVKSSSASITLKSKVPTVDEFNKAVTDSLKIVNGSSDLIDIKKGADGKIVVSFPSKAWLNYTIYTVEKGRFAEYADPLSLATIADTDAKVKNADYLTENSTLRVAIPVTAAGEKEIYVLVEPKNSSVKTNAVYGWGDAVVSAKSSLTFGKISVKADTSAQAAVWTSVAHKKARVYWKPATKTSGENFATTDFVIYRKQNGEIEKVTGTVTVDTTTGYYFIDDTLPLTSADAVYYIVLTDGTLYGAKKSATLSAKTIADATGATITVSNAASFDGDGVSNDLLVTVKLPADETLEYLGYAELYHKLSDYDYKELTIPTVYTEDSGYKVYVLAEKDVDDGTYIFRAKTTKENYADKWTYSANTGVTVNSSLSTTDTPSIELADAWRSITNSVEEISSNWIYTRLTAGNKNQTLKLAYGYSPDNANLAKAAFYQGATAVTIPEPYSAVTDSKIYEFIQKGSEDEGLADGYYYFVLTASEEGYNSKVVAASIRINTAIGGYTDAPTLQITKTAYGSDNKYNDLYIIASKGNSAQTLTLYYGYDETSPEVAEAKARAKATKWDLGTKNYNDYYRIIKNDLPDGYYYIYLLAEEEGMIPQEAVYGDWSSSNYIPYLTIDTYVEEFADRPWWVWIDDIGSNGKTFKILGSHTEDFTLKYGYSTISQSDACYEAYTNPKTVELPAKATNTTADGWGSTYGFDVKDLDAGYYWFVIECKDGDKTPVTVDYNTAVWVDAHYDENDNYVSAGYSPSYARQMSFYISKDAVASSDDNALGDITISSLNFINKDGDGKYDDLADFTVTIPGNTSIKAVRYISAPYSKEAENLVLSGGTAVKKENIPTPDVQYNEQDPDGSLESVKIYTFSKFLDNVFKDGINSNYYAIIVEIDDESEDENWNHKYAIASAQPTVIPNSNNRMSLQVLLRNVGSGQFEDDFAVTVKDRIYVEDSIENYTYKVQYAVQSLDGLLEKEWTDAKANIKLSIEDGTAGSYYPKNEYVYNDNGYGSYQDVYYKSYESTFNMDNNAQGRYFFRLIKHSNLDGTDKIVRIYNTQTVNKTTGGNSDPDYNTLSSITWYGLGETGYNTNGTRKTQTFRITLTSGNNSFTMPDSNYSFEVYRASWTNEGTRISYNNDTYFIVSDYTKVASTNDFKAWTYKDTSNNTQWRYNGTYEVEDKAVGDGNYIYYVKAINQKTGAIVYSSTYTLN